MIGKTGSTAFVWELWSVSLVGVALELKCVIETNLISNKMEHFSYRGGCGMHGHTHIKAFKEELAWATDKRLPVISNIKN